MIKNLIFTALVLMAGIGLLAGAKVVQIQDLIQAASTMSPPPASVATVEALEQQWEVTLASVGTVEAVQGVMISADIPGRVVSIEFEPGAMVKAGDVLIRQDISSEQAQLRAAEATAALAKANLTRVKELVDKKVASQAELDTVIARHKEAMAAADTYRTTIAKKTIVAPFDGHLGLRQVNLGQDLASGTPIVSLQAIEKLQVNFSLPQQNIAAIKAGLEVRLTTEALGQQERVVGRVTAIDPQVDAATRSIQVQAEFDNHEQLLLPGMFVSVEVLMPEMDTVLAVPKTAISYATFGDSVFVIEPGEQAGQVVAKQHFVQLGRSKGDYVAITKGISVGSRVVSAGVFKLRNGAPVAVNDEVQPNYQVAPTPNDA